jgi:hypothetical protein
VGTASNGRLLKAHCRGTGFGRFALLEEGDDLVKADRILKRGAKRLEPKDEKPQQCLDEVAFAVAPISRLDRVAAGPVLDPHNRIAKPGVVGRELHICGRLDGTFTGG